MSAVATQLPVGTWQVDRTHSTVGFEVDHTLAGTFRGTFGEYDATLSVGEAGARLEGSVEVASVDIRDENLNGHLQSPDFFDAERHPQLRFVSRELQVEGDGDVVLEGDLTMRGETRPVRASGRIVGLGEDDYGNERVALRLEAQVDRTEYGISWNAPLPSGAVTLGDVVTLQVALAFVKEA